MHHYLRLATIHSSPDAFLKSNVFMVRLTYSKEKGLGVLELDVTKERRHHTESLSIQSLKMTSTFVLLLHLTGWI